MEKGLALGCIIIGILVNFQGASCITCLHCEGAEYLSDCFAGESVHLCNANETCYMEKKINLETGRHQFFAGCRNIKLCHLDSCQKAVFGDANSRAVADLLLLPVCSECCYEDNCNIELCGAEASSIPSNITQCYSCDNKNDQSICKNTVECDLKLQNCYVQKNVDGSYNLGCIKARQCGLLMQLSDIENGTRCCQKHLCNGNPNTPKLDKGSVFKEFSCPPNLAHLTTTKLSTTQITKTSAPQTYETKTNAPNTTTPPHTTSTTTTTTATAPITTTIATAPTTTTSTAPSTARTTTTKATAPTTTITATAPTSTTVATAPITTIIATTPTTSTKANTPTTTTAATTPTTTTAATTPTTTTTALPTVAASTAPPPKTLPPVTTSCAVCAGPAFLCEKLFASTPCPAPDNYCINSVINHKDGTRTVDRKCGDFDTCYREWFQGSSDDDKCRKFDENEEQRLDFQCTYCCVTDDCNIPLRPDAASLYKPA